MPAPKYTYENTALFTSLMLAAGAGKISVTVMKERKREERRIYIHLKQQKAKFSPSMHVLNNINFLILHEDVYT